MAQIPRASFLAQGFLSGCMGFAAKPSLWEGRQGPGRNLNCGGCHTSCFSQSPREDAEVQTLSISGRVLQISDARQSSVLMLRRGPSCHGGALLCEESEHTVHFPNPKPFWLLGVFSSQSRFCRVSWGWCGALRAGSIPLLLALLLLALLSARKPSAHTND